MNRISNFVDILVQNRRGFDKLIGMTAINDPDLLKDIFIAIYIWLHPNYGNYDMLNDKTKVKLFKLSITNINPIKNQLNTTFLEKLLINVNVDTSLKNIAKYEYKMLSDYYYYTNILDIYDGPIAHFFNNILDCKINKEICYHYPLHLLYKTNHFFLCLDDFINKRIKSNILFSDYIINQCIDYLSDTINNKKLEKHFDKLNDNDKATITDILDVYCYPYIQKFINKLRSIKSVDAIGLIHIKNGTKYYKLLVKKETDSSPQHLFSQYIEHIKPLLKKIKDIQHIRDTVKLNNDKIINYYEKSKLLDFHRCFREGMVLFDILINDDETLFYVYNLLSTVTLVLDIGIHHFGWSKETITEFMNNNCPIADYECLISKIVQSPGSGCFKKVGFEELVNIKISVNKILGNSFDKYDFYNKLIENGPMMIYQFPSFSKMYIKSKN